MKLNSEIKISLDGGSCDIKPQFLGKTTFIYSREYPIIHDVLMRVARGALGVMDNLNYVADYNAVEYLNRCSLKDALQDKALAPEILQDIIRKKSEELRSYLTLQTGEEQFRQFYVNFLGEHLFEEVLLEDFLRQFYQTFSFRLDSLVKNWYETKGLAMFEVRNARVIEIKETEEVSCGMYEFKVFNKSDVAGIIMTSKNTGWVIPPREAREIHARIPGNMAKQYGSFYLKMPLSQNIPSVMYLERIEVSQADTITRVFSVDTSLFLPKGDEIIVDNEDPSFRIVKAKDNFITSLFRKEKSSKRYYDIFLEDAWLPAINENFYGFPVRSALYKREGSGKQKVEWNAVLPQAGKYEVFFYYTELFSEGVTKRIHYYMVSDGEQEYKVTATPSKEDEGSWVSLGVYEFTKNAKVTLSDRVTEESVIAGFVADAVKWVRVE